MTGNYYEDYYGMVKRIASEYASKFYGVGREDIEQELWLWFVEHPRKTEEWMGMDNQKDSDRLFAKSLRNKAHDFCLKEKARMGGYSVNDTFWYTKDFIKLLLPAALSSDKTRLNNVLSQQPRKEKSYSESGDWLAYSADIQSAFESLGRAEQQLVYLFYAQDVDGKELHNELGEEDSTARATMMRANRALNKMVKFLGGYKPYKDEDYPEPKEEEEEETEDDL
jgi:DNA-directed RNA polymerase specialized sigma24 family protein